MKNCLHGIVLYFLLFMPAHIFAVKKVGVIACAEALLFLLIR